MGFPGDEQVREKFSPRPVSSRMSRPKEIPSPAQDELASRQAQASGARLSLETGWWTFFVPAREFYRGAGLWGVSAFRRRRARSEQGLSRQRSYDAGISPVCLHPGEYAKTAA